MIQGWSKYITNQHTLKVLGITSTPLLDRSNVGMKFEKIVCACLRDKY